jgi:nicotinate-nucleotide pyrophosphorylase
MSLSDAALVKDNHVVAAGGVAAAFAAVRRAFPGVPVEVECDTVEQVREVLDAGADWSCSTTSGRSGCASAWRCAGRAGC